MYFSFHYTGHVLLTIGVLKAKLESVFNAIGRVLSGDAHETKKLGQSFFSRNPTQF